MSNTLKSFNRNEALHLIQFWPELFSNGKIFIFFAFTMYCFKNNCYHD